MLFLALRQLLSKKKQTILTLMGIILGTAAYVAISGMMLGFQVFIIDQLVNNDSHVRIKAREEVLSEQTLKEAFFDELNLINWIRPPSGKKDNSYILSPLSWIERLESNPEVFAVSSQMVVQGIATIGGNAQGVRIIGSIPEKQRRVSNIESYMVKGKFTDIGNSGNRIIVGEDFAKNIGVTLNETILLTVGKGDAQPFKIVGFFKLGVKALDESTLFASLSDVQNLNQTPSRITDIAIRLYDVSKASDLSLNWNLMGQEKVQSWDQANEGIMSVFKTQDITRNAMTISILIVAGFGIYNILSLAVTHRRREIAILRSIGFEPKDVVKLFFIQGLILGVIGGVLGALLGYSATFGMSLIEVSGNRGLGGNRMMVSYDFWIYVKAFGLAVFCSSFAGYLPSRAAGKLEPIDIIRGEDS